MDLSTVLIFNNNWFVAGILSGIVMGGGLIIIPLLMLWLGVDQITSQGTSMFLFYFSPVGILLQHLIIIRMAMLMLTCCYYYYCFYF